jgi:hypothetical protein
MLDRLTRNHGLTAPVARDGPAGKPVFPDLHVNAFTEASRELATTAANRRWHWRPAQADQRSGHPGWPGLRLLALVRLRILGA